MYTKTKIPGAPNVTHVLNSLAAKQRVHFSDSEPRGLPKFNKTSSAAHCEPGPVQANLELKKNGAYSSSGLLELTFC